MKFRSSPAARTRRGMSPFDSMNAPAPRPIDFRKTLRSNAITFFLSSVRHELRGGEHCDAHAGPSLICITGVGQNSVVQRAQLSEPFHRRVGHVNGVQL